jgi:hypothetical protein
VVRGATRRRSISEERRPAVGDHSDVLLKHREREEGVRNLLNQRETKTGRLEVVPPRMGNAGEDLMNFGKGACALVPLSGQMARRSG